MNRSRRRNCNTVNAASLARWIVMTVFLALAGLALLPRLHFDFDPLKLKDPHSESAATMFELDLSRSAVPPPHGALVAPELRATMLAVDAELTAGGPGGPLMIESLANVLAVRLIRYITGSSRLKGAADGVLPRHKVRRVIEYIMENLEGNPTLEGMAAVVHLSLYHFSRQFKAATGFAPHQFVIARRIERAQHLLRTNGELGLAEVALRSGFANQGHFCLHFKRIAGVTPRRFRENANGRTILE